MSVHKKILEKHGQVEQPIEQQPQYSQQQFTQKQQTQIDEDIQSQLQEFQPYNSLLNIRCTANVFPKSKQAQMDSKIPFALVIQPYGQSVKQGFPSVSYGSYPILRCNNCRAYVNPYMKFMDGGDYMRCNLCTLITKVPYLFQKPEQNEQRADLTMGSYDIKAGQEYQARPPMPPTYFFMIDVSTKSEGVLGIMGQVIKDLIIEEKFNERTLFGFITFDTSIHVYNFNSKLQQPQMFVLTDASDLPLPGEFLFNLQDSKDIIVAFLNQLDRLFPKPQLKSTQFMAALSLSQKILADVGGKLIILTSHPITELNLPDNNKLQQPFLQATNQTFFNKSQEMHFQYICPSIFIIPSGFNNLFTISQLVKYLNGDVFYYDDPQIYTQKFYYDLKSVLSKDYTWEAVFRIRPSIGWRVKSMSGNYTVKSNDLLSVTCMDDQKTIIYELELTQPNAASENMYIQTALLYTSTNGERRIRVHNMCIPLSNSIATIYSQIDQPCLAAVLFRFSLGTLSKAKDVTEAKEFIISAGRSIIQTSKLCRFPLEQLYAYLLGIMKQQLMNYQYNSASILTDYMNYFRIIYSYLNVDELISCLVPQLYNISKLENECFYDDTGSFVYPPPISLSLEEIMDGGLFLMDCGYALFMYICKIHDEEQLSDIFGKQYQSMNLIEDNLYSNSSNPINTKLHYLLTELRNNKFTKYAPLYIIRQGSRTLWEDTFLQNLIYDDLNKSFRMGYNQFVQYIG